MSDPATHPADQDNIPGQALTPDEELWFAVRDDAIRNGVTRLNDATARLLTLATALAGGSIIWLKDVCPDWSRLGAAFLFIAALGVAVVGTVPFAASGPATPDAIADRVERAGRWKGRILWSSCLLILGGFMVAFLGAVTKAVTG